MHGLFRAAHKQWTFIDDTKCVIGVFGADGAAACLVAVDSPAVVTAALRAKCGIGAITFGQTLYFMSCKIYETIPGTFVAFHQ